MSSEAMNRRAAEAPAESASAPSRFAARGPALECSEPVTAPLPQVLDYIPDGYIEEGYIRAAAGLHGSVRFTFRPMRVVEQAALFGQRMLSLPEELQDRRCADVLCSHLISWSVVDANGRTLELTAENILRLKPALFQRLLAIVSGIEPSDIYSKTCWCHRESLPSGTCG